MRDFQLIVGGEVKAKIVAAALRSELEPVGSYSILEADDAESPVLGTFILSDGVELKPGELEGS